MKITRLMFVFAAMLMVSACSNDIPESNNGETNNGGTNNEGSNNGGSENGNSDNGGTAVQKKFSINASIIGTSRAPQIDSNGAGRFTDGDENTLFFHTKDEQHLRTFEYVYGTDYLWSDILLPEEVTTSHISACYPTIDTKTPQSFDWDIRENAQQDLLLATPVETTVNSSTPVSLTFKHAMHKLSVNLDIDQETRAAEGVEEAKIICKNVLPIANFNLFEGKMVEAKGEPFTLEITGNEANFIIPEQAVGAIEVEIQIGERKASYKLAELVVDGKPLEQLENGLSFDLDIKVTKESFSIVGQEIAGWGSQGEFDGSIIL